MDNVAAMAEINCSNNLLELFPGILLCHTAMSHEMVCRGTHKSQLTHEINHKLLVKCLSLKLFLKPDMKSTVKREKVDKKRRSPVLTKYLPTTGVFCYQIDHSLCLHHLKIKKNDGKKAHWDRLTPCGRRLTNYSSMTKEQPI